VLIPLHCEYFALEGLADLVGTMRRVRSALNPALDIEGVLLTMYDDRTNLGQSVARDVRDFFKRRSSTRSFRATCDSAKRRVTESPACCTTRNPAARPHMSHSRKSCSLDALHRNGHHNARTTPRTRQRP
jgi:cellulose biosynthesis protein BcsQ